MNWQPVTRRWPWLVLLCGVAAMVVGGVVLSPRMIGLAVYLVGLVVALFGFLSMGEIHRAR